MAATPAAQGFHVQAIPATELEHLWTSGVDRFGNSLVVTVNDEVGGALLRCCLTEAQVGERVALAAYKPFPFEGAYAEVGPIYIHADRCHGYPAVDRYPASFRHRDQVFRAYGHTDRIMSAEVVHGRDAEEAITRLLANPEVAFLHSRNVLYGCYMFTIHRGGADAGVGTSSSSALRSPS